MPNVQPPVERVGFRLKAWCGAVGIGRSTLYTLPDHLRPKSVKIGKARVITEKPSDYLCRIGKQI